MEFKCKECGARNEYNEEKYPGGSTIELPCRRCGTFNVVEIPLASENSKNKSNLQDDIQEKEQEPQNPNEDKLTPPPVPKRKAKRAPAKKRVTSQPVVSPVNNIPATGSNNKGSSNVGCLVIILIIGATIACIWGLRQCGSSNKEPVNDMDSAVIAEPIVDTEPILYEDVVDTMSIDSTDFSDSAAFEEVAAIEEEEPADRINYKMGFHSGKNSFNGNMIHTDGRLFPFTLEFYYYPKENKLDNIVYVNSTSGTRVKMEATEFSPSFVKFEGKDGGKAFIIQFSDTDPYSGDAWWGDFHQDIELYYR